MYRRAILHAITRKEYSGLRSGKKEVAMFYKPQLLKKKKNHLQNNEEKIFIAMLLRLTYIQTKKKNQNWKQLGFAAENLLKGIP